MSGREIMVGDKPLSSLRVVDLKAELEKRGLSKSGSKKDLVDRLKANLLIDKDRQEAASVANADEVELPNIAAKLPDDNPFVREYLASQAELFHSQQVAKKLYREEQKRESEGSGASADERERSPLKSPSKTVESASPLRHEFTRGNSSEREKSPEKRSTRGRPALPSKSAEVVVEDKTPEVPKDEDSPPPKRPIKIKPIPTPEELETPSESAKIVEVPGSSASREEAQPLTRSSRRGRRSSDSIDSNTVELEKAESSSPVKIVTSDAAVTEAVSPRAAREPSPEKRSTRSRAPVPLSKVAEAEDSTTAQVTTEVEEASSTRTKSPTMLAPPAESVKAIDTEVTPEVAKKSLPPTQAEPDRVDSHPQQIPESSSVQIQETDLNSVTDSPAKSKRDEPKVTSPPKSESPEKRSSRSRRKSSGPPHKPGEEGAATDSGSHPVQARETVVVQESKMEVIPASPEKSEQAEPLVTPEINKAGLEKPKRDDDDSKAESPLKRSPRKSRFQEAPPPDPEAEPQPMEAEQVFAQEKPVQSAHIEFTAPEIVQPLKRTESPPPRKGRSHSPITAPTPEPAKVQMTEPKKKAVEKESILDEVLDYGEEDQDVDEGVGLEETSIAASVKRSSLISSRSSRQGAEALGLEEPETEFQPLVFERRALNLKTNRHTQRRKDKILEERKAREKERERSKIPDYTITTELLSEWYPNMVMLTDEEIALDESNVHPLAEEEERVRITRTISNVEMSDVQAVASGDWEADEEEAKPEMDLTIQRKISLVSMEGEKKKGGQTPPRRAPTQLILVTNLVRPFTVPQLKELLQRTGSVLDLWVDKIKSRCVAKYDTEDEAIETRTALHGVKWPSSNPKLLKVDFTTEERADDLRKKEEGYIEEKPVASQHVREWDVGKKSPLRQARKRSHSRENREREGRGEERERKRSRRSRSHSAQGTRHARSPHSDRKDRNGDIKKSESSGKTLDELFRKTVGVPCIYWLPLNPQQISEKEELRRKRMEERERRIAEMQQQQNQRSQR